MSQKKFIAILLLIGVLSACTISNPPVQSSSSTQNEQNSTSNKPQLMLILDSSGSMADKDEYGNVKIDIAKDVLSTVLNKIPTGTTNVGLMTYDNCQTKVLVPPSNSNLELVRSRAMRVNAFGRTPIASSIRSAQKILEKSRGKTTLLLISDGKETCDNDPCAAAKILKQSNASVSIYTVGYSVDKKTQQQLQCIASVGGGRYFEAKDSVSLGNVARQIVWESTTKAFDTDGDGISNDQDACPNTLRGFSVDSKGCEDFYTFNIQFDFDSALIKPKFEPTIKNLAKYLKTSRSTVQLQGHTDSKGSSAYNKRLSNKRAKAIMRSLIKYGIPKKQLSFIGFGEERPIASNDTSLGRYKNRRVEAHFDK